MERVTDCILGGFKITADGDCRHEIIRCLLFGRKVMINLGSIIKSRDFTLPTKVYTQNRKDSQKQKTNLWSPNRRRRERGTNKNYEINKYKPPYIKQISNKDLLYSTENYVQCLLITYNKI